MTMDARKQRVLQAIVALYGLEGEPVGSSVLANYFDMAVSSATLRNEMAALTKLGLLEQPHTSAGRVPSPKGYRYYLDHLLEAPAAIALSAADRENIDRLFADMDVEPEKLAQSAARALADYTGCAAVATTPQAEDLCIALADALGSPDLFGNDHPPQLINPAHDSCCFHWGTLLPFHILYNIPIIWKVRRFMYGSCLFFVSALSSPASRASR